MKVATLLLALSLSAPATAQTPDGGALFRQRCQMCHTTDASKGAGLGPNLAHVAERKAAATSFNYSPALKAAGLSWDKATLDRFLTDPTKMVPGTRMVVAVSDPAQRAAIVSYLGRLK